MADVVVTAANVIADPSATIVDGKLGASVTAGQELYLDPADNTYKLADANASATTGNYDGTALTGGAMGQPVKVLTDGVYTCGGTVVAGTVYVLSATPGAFCPAADLVTGMYTNVKGVAISTTKILVRRIKSGVAVP